MPKKKYRAPEVKSSSPVIFQPAVKMRVFSGEHCPPCEAMKKAGTWDKLAKHFKVPLELVNLDKDKNGPELQERYEVYVVPTCQLEDAEGNVLADFTGSGTLASCIEALDVGLAP